MTDDTRNGSSQMSETWLEEITGNEITIDLAHYYYPKTNGDPGDDDRPCCGRLRYLSSSQHDVLLADDGTPCRPFECDQCRLHFWIAGTDVLHIPPRTFRARTGVRPKPRVQEEEPEEVPF